MGPGALLIRKQALCLDDSLQLVAGHGVVVAHVNDDCSSYLSFGGADDLRGERDPCVIFAVEVDVDSFAGHLTSLRSRL